MICFLQGEFVSEDEAKVSVLDRGFLYGDSVYETVRAVRGKIVFLEEHAERLRRSARLLGLDITPEPYDLLDLLRQLLRRNRLDSAAMRIIVSRGRGGRDQLEGFTPTWVVLVEPYESLPEERYESGVAAMIVSVVRNAVGALNPGIKSSNLLNNVLARREAVQRGAAEGIMLSPDGCLAEGAHTNLFWVTADRTLRTPALSVGILAGVTRQKVLELARKLGIACEEVAARPAELEEASEVFLTSTKLEVMAVTTLNGRSVGNGRRGETTRRLHVELRRLFDLEGESL
jgi:branched-chain amino acid aminotransferase